MAKQEIESEFVLRIDANFPYQDKLKCLKLIDEAALISPNALFAVTEEICRVPYGDKVSTTHLLDLLTEVKTKFDHPLKEMILDAAFKMVQGQLLMVDEAISKMNIVRKFPGQFAALNILCFSCDDSDNKLESVWEGIHNDWRSI